ncbi:MAG: GatB/YqeY domain-containing protein [Patescibacteria group bacterium]
MIVDNIQKQIMDAMKAHDEVKLSTLRMLSSELHNFKIDHPEMTEEEELGVVKKEAKKRKDAILAYEKAGNKARAESESAELAILQEFLPAEVDDTDLSRFVDEAISETGASDISSMGKVIGAVMAKTSGNADGSKVASLVREKLTK